MSFIVVDSTRSLAFKDRDFISLDKIGINKNDKTWYFNDCLRDRNNIDYGWLLSEGENIEKYCSSDLINIYSILDFRYKAFLSAATTSKIDISKIDIRELVPLEILSDFYDLQCKTIDDVFIRNPKPSNYDFLLETEKLLSEIRNQTLKIDLGYLKQNLYEVRARDYLKSLNDKKEHIVDYNIFGSKTGRLTTKKHSFPILTLDSKYRSIIKSKNDFFLELDFQCAEVRTLFHLSDINPPENDIHKWNSDRLGLSREAVKKKTFAFLYGQINENSDIVPNFERIQRILKDKYVNNDKIQTIFDREIISDNEHWLSHLIQSITNDLVLKQILKIKSYLVDNKAKTKSNIAFMIHDSLILDVDDWLIEHFKEILNIFSETNLGRYSINVKIGEDFGTMKKVEL